MEVKEEFRGNLRYLDEIAFEDFHSVSLTSFPTQLDSLTPFFEEVMKWACLKMPDLCLPKANA
jgi:hypothetical protein